MKILFVDQTGELGGGELSLLEYLRHTSHTPEVVLFTDGPFRELLEKTGVATHLLPLGKAGEVRREAGLGSLGSAVPALWEMRARLRPLMMRNEAVYANSQKAFVASALSLPRQRPLVWHLRDMLDAQHFSPAMRWLAVQASRRRASAIIANSEATRQALLRAGGEDAKTAVIYNGVDPAPFAAVGDAEIAAERQALGLTGKYLVGAFGRLTPWKGQEVLLEAVEELPDVHVLLVGEALFGEQAYAERLRSRVQERGLGHRVHFLGFRRDIAQLMRVCDCVAHTATSPEPFGRVIVEGMLARRPVIATRAGGALEIVQDGTTGLLVEPGDARALRDAIVQLKDQPERAGELAEAGYLRAVSQFSVGAMVRKIDELLEGLRSGKA